MDTGNTQQQSMPETGPLKEHQWLDKFVGEWTFEGEMSMGPEKPLEKFTGSESVRSIGGRWIMSEAHGAEAPGGGAATMVLTIGYDPQKKRYVGTWIDSMMSYLWVYEGSVDPAGKIITLSADGPDMSKPGKVAKYKDVTEFETPDHRVLTSHVLRDDGTWHRLMTAHYHRKK